MAYSSQNQVDLDRFSDAVLAHFERLRDRGGPYGCFRRGVGQRPDLYASCDIAIAHQVMGLDLRARLTEAERRSWIDHINSYTEVEHNQETSGGVYFDRLGHGVAHANGMVVGALAVLGGRQPEPVALYEAVATEERVLRWLETEVQWDRLWAGSHEIWGRLVTYSFSRRCDDGWRRVVLDWLDRETEPSTGMWRRGVPPADRHQGIGGAAHILPLYDLHGRGLAHPRAMIDTVLALQLPGGCWLADSEEKTNYLELDALYLLWVASRLCPDHRPGDIRRAVDRYADVAIAYQKREDEPILQVHPHRTLGALGVFGLLQRLCPDRVYGSRVWSDIFTDPLLHATHAVEAEA